MNTVNAWNVLVVIDLVAGGIGVGAFLFAVFTSTFKEQRYRLLSKTGFYISPVAVGIGLIFLLAKLGRPERFITTLFRVNPYSIMSWGVFIQTIFLLLAGIIFLLTFFNRNQGRLYNAIKISGAVFALAVGIYHGLLLSTNINRPLWNDSLIPFLFLNSSLLTGSAAVLLFSPIIGIIIKKLLHLFRRDDVKEEAIKDPSNHQFLYEKFLIVLLVIQTTMIFTWLTKISISGLIADKAFQVLLMDNWVFWWIGTIILGLLLPLFFITYRFIKKNSRTYVTIPIASVLILTGGYIFKHVILFAGQIEILSF